MEFARDDDASDAPTDDESDRGSDASHGSEEASESERSDYAYESADERDDDAVSHDSRARSLGCLGAPGRCAWLTSIAGSCSASSECSSCC